MLCIIILHACTQMKTKRFQFLALITLFQWHHFTSARVKYSIIQNGIVNDIEFW